MPILSTEKKDEVLNAGKAVYSGYLLLDFCTNNYYTSRNKSFRINGGNENFKEFVVKEIEQAEQQHLKKITQEFSLNGKKYTLKLRKRKNEDWKVKIIGESGVDEVPTKPVNEYTPEEFVQLVKQHTLTITKEESTGDYKFATYVAVNNKKVSIGGKIESGKDQGKGRRELYQLHINNLYAMLQNLSSDAPNYHMLVAMATGSGKSYTQALWFLIMYLSDCSCVFAAPKDQNVTQLKDDFCKLLPDKLTKDIKLDEFPKDGKTPFYTITTYKNLFIRFWSRLYSKDKSEKNKNLFLSFDEEHEAAKVELYKKRIKLLTKKHPAMLLSATPSKVAYELCGGKAVASLSKKQKEELGLGKPAISYSVKAKPVAMKGKNILKRLILKFVDAIEKPRISSAHTYLHKSEMAVHYRKQTDPFYAVAQNNVPEEKELRRLVRWNIQCPIGDKALILTGQHDPVININAVLRKDAMRARDIYKNGNSVPRGAAYQFFHLPNVDRSNYLKLQNSKKDFRQKSFENYLKKIYPNLQTNIIRDFVSDNVDFSETVHDANFDYLSYRIYHGLIENVLEFLTGLDSAKLDYKRFHDLQGLTEHILKKIDALPKDIHGNIDESQIIGILQNRLLNEKIPDPEAAKIAKAMTEVIKALASKAVSPDLKEAIVDNWKMDRKIHQFFRLKKPVEEFAIQFKTVFLMTGLGKTATPIEDNAPFYHLDEESHRLCDYEPAREPPLKHKLSTLEVVDDATMQNVYRPNYCEKTLTPAVIDKLFLKGLIGAYITNERATGFNDLNLCHVVMILDKHDKLNRADQITQGSGRNRGQNPAQLPYFIMVLDESVSMAFSPKLLEKENYFPDLFKARSRNHKEIVSLLGAKIADELQSWIDASVDPHGNVNPEALQIKVREILLDEFDNIYQENDHDFNKAKTEFCAVLEDTYQALHAGANSLNHSYKLNFSAKVIASILNVISQTWYSIITLPSRIKFIRAANAVSRQPEKYMPEITYAHIVRNYNYKEIMKYSIGGSRLVTIMEGLTNKAVEYAQNNPENYPEADQFRDLLSETLARFVESKIYRRIVNKILAPLTEEHLLTMLNALYPDSENKEKVKLIIEYKKDLNAKMTAKQLFEKYYQFTDSDDIKDANFNRIHFWLNDIYEEVINSVCYYQNMSDKGDSDVEKYPRLTRLKDGHDIWSLKDTHNSFLLTNIARKTQFITASINAFDPLNQVEALKDQPTQQVMRDTAKRVIAATREGIKSKKHKAKTSGLKESKEMSIAFGQLFAQGKSLTSKEIKSSKTKALSAVENIRKKAGVKS